MSIAPAATGVFSTAADPAAAVAHFGSRLAFETDVSDVAAALGDPDPGFVLVDTRSDAAWAQGRIPGAVHLPTRRIAQDAATMVGDGGPIVVYCWGPGCNGAQRAALEFARLGHPVKEMLGGFEYWVREGFAIETPDGRRAFEPDPLTNVAHTGLGESVAASAARSATATGVAASPHGAVTCAC